MSGRNRIPSAIEPYLRLPPETSSTLLTGTLGCSVNWLTARFVGSFLNETKDLVPGDYIGNQLGVVLVSWIQDLPFWRNEIRRETGVDLSKLGEDGRFTYVDCFSPQSTPRTGDQLAESESKISDAISKTAKSGEREVVLLLDSPDMMLAIGSSTALQLNETVFNLRGLVHSVVITCSAELPLISAARPCAEHRPSPLEVETAAFIAQQAHVARCVMSVRALETGAARDVSGVLRVTRGGGIYDENSDGAHELRAMESLYLVQRDGNVKVFERGADVG